MTDKPTLSLDPQEWRAMLGHNLNRAVEFVTSNNTVTAEHVQVFHQHLDRMKALASAWHLSAVPATTQTLAPQPQPEIPSAAKGNGVAPKRKGGWPKGKSRKQRNAPREAMQ